MKKILVIKYLALLIVGCSGQMDKPVEYRFEIINESGVDLKILSYDSEDPNTIQKTIEITNNYIFRKL